MRIKWCGEGAIMYKIHFIIQVMSEFSVPVSISQRRSPLATPEQETEEVQVIVWMLQHHLLIQLHTYVQIVVDDPLPVSTKSPFRNAKTVITSNKTKQYLIDWLISNISQRKRRGWLLPAANRLRTTWTSPAVWLECPATVTWHRSWATKLSPVRRRTKVAAVNRTGPSNAFFRPLWARPRERQSSRSTLPPNSKIWNSLPGELSKFLKFKKNFF